MKLSGVEKASVPRKYVCRNFDFVEVMSGQFCDLTDDSEKMQKKLFFSEITGESMPIISGFS